MKPKVSVVMAVYNADRFLEKSISSILRQQMSDWELVIVDDCSNDRSGEIIDCYASTDARIRVLKNDSNCGPCNSRNRALQIARGQYIAVLDSDDVSLPARLSTQAAYLDNHPEISLVGCGAIKIDEHGARLGRHVPIANWRRLGNKLTRRNRLYHSTVMFRNAGYLYRDKLSSAEDYDLYLRMLSDGRRIAAIAKPLVEYRILRDGISGKYSGRQKLLAETALSFYRQRIESGSDAYDRFDPSSILGMDPRTSENVTILKSEIAISLKLRDFSRMRLSCRRYFRSHGYNLKFLLLYLSSLGMEPVFRTITAIKPRGSAG
jgi:glycosyltransferase involved in cell wall biosynthesis